MVEYILIISLYSGGMAGNKALSVDSVAIPFYSEDECNSAGAKVKSNLIEGVTAATTNVSYVCVKRTVLESGK